MLIQIREDGQQGAECHPKLFTCRRAKFFEGEVHAIADGVARDAQGRGDLVVGLALFAVKQEHLAGPRRQRVQCSFDKRFIIAMQGFVIPAAVALVELPRDLPFDDVRSARRPQHIYGVVAGRVHQIALEVVHPFQSLAFLPDLDQYLL